VIGKRTIDRAVTIVAAAAAPALSILTRHHVITAADATDYGAIILATVSGYHGGAYVQRKRATPPIIDRAPADLPPFGGPTTAGRSGV
jgi:hypothetical protein